MRSILPRALLAAALAASLLGCKDKASPAAPARAAIVMNAKSAPPVLADFKGKNGIKGTIDLDGALPAGTRVMLAIKLGGGLRTLDDGGDFTVSFDLTEPTASVPFEINDLSDGAYRLKALAYVDLKARLKDPARRLLGKDDYAGVYTGAEGATQDFKQAKPIEVKGEQSVTASIRLAKIQ